MAYINTIPPESATGVLSEIYGRIAAPGGQVDNVLQVHSLRPHSLEGHMALYKAVLHHTGNRLPVWYLEAIGVLVSELNGCSYCARHHAEGMRRLLDDPDRFNALARALATESPGEPFSDAEQAGLSYARALSLDPGGIGEADIKRMRDAGLDDGEILEINQVSAYFAYANRTVSGLGVDTEGEVLGLSPGEGDSLDEWGHD